MDAKDLDTLSAKAREIRKLTIDAIGFLGVGHIGGALSIVEALVLLYYRHMDVSPGDPRRETRDRLVLSKGHAGPALYSILADRGFFPLDWLHTLNRGGTRLPSHCDRIRTPGIDMSTGSLGQGLSAAIGIALANRLDGRTNKVYAILGDGECNEGQVWEAAMAAAHFRLHHLIAFVDFNKMQIDGLVADIMGVEDMGAKWSAFGWAVQRVDGHDLAALNAAIALAKLEQDRPSMIVMDTIKGKGAFFAENRVENHNMKYDYATALEANRRLDEAAVSF